MEEKRYLFDSQFSNKWYFRLLENGLLQDMKDEEKDKDLIVMYLNSRGTRFYTNFDDYMNFYDFFQSLPKEKRCCDEVILEHKLQKVRFDIDAKKTDLNCDQIQLVIESIIEKTMIVFQEMGYVLDIEKDILICSSNGENKWSYHIIVDNYCCENCHEVKAIVERVVQKIPSNYNKFIDLGIYSPNHALRIIGSTKLKEYRPKKLEHEFIFMGDQFTHQFPETPINHGHLFFMELESTLITNVGKCIPMLRLLKDEDIEHKHRIINPSFDDEETDDIVKQSLCKLNEVVGDSTMCFYRLIGNMILLKKGSSKINILCPICDRSHENQNGYLLLRDANREKLYDYRYEVLFDCRRREKNVQMKSLGYIVKEIPKNTLSFEINDDTSQESCNDEYSNEEDEPENLYMVIEKQFSNLSLIKYVDTVMKKIIELFYNVVEAGTWIELEKISDTKFSIQRDDTYYCSICDDFHNDMNDHLSLIDRNELKNVEFRYEVIHLCEKTLKYESLGMIEGQKRMTNVNRLIEMSKHRD